MHITALTVCVDYDDYLERGLIRWRDGVEQLLVITAPHDTRTQALCAANNVPVFLTSVFYDNGARFNKGAAMAAAFAHTAPQDWVLFFDADIVPPPDWRTKLDAMHPEAGSLYGAYRYDTAGDQLGDKNVAGFFNLANIRDPHMQVRPIVDTHWRHAGNYDDTFRARWPISQQIRLPLQLLHLGDTDVNWCGRGNNVDMQMLRAERRKRGGRWDHETVPPPKID